jgi:hypothetical protein
MFIKRFFFFIAFWISSLPSLTIAQLVGERNLNSADVVFVGESAGDQAGYHISMAGDVNHDGIGDLLIAAPYNSDAGVNFGQVYLLFGKSGAWGNTINLGTADASFLGETKNDWASHDVFGLGDINGDEIDDFAIGVKFVDQAAFNAGKTYVFFGKETGWSLNTSLSNADASFLGEDSTSEAGHVAAAGDINGDGINDIIIGGGFNDQAANDAGKTYIVFGKKTGWGKNISLANADASFLGETEGDYSGHRLAGVGDVNNDGIDDIIIAAHGADANSIKNRGKVYLIFGKTSGWSQNASLSIAEASFVGPPVMNTSIGWNVCSASDINADGYSDFLIAAQNKSKIYLILGKSSGWQQDMEIESAAATIFSGETALDHAGYDMRGAGDINLDGKSDFIIGAYSNDQNGVDAGKSYLFYGRSSWTTNVNLATADASFLGEAAGDQSGFSVAGGGDVNDDGIDDLLISANLNDQNGQDAGKVYLLFGKSNDFVLTEPNGGETWNIGEQITIVWHSADPQGNVRIELSRDGGNTWEFIKETQDDGAAFWEISGPASNNCLVRVTNLSTGLSDMSDAQLSIIQPSITLLSPNGGEKWLAGDVRVISWQSVGNIQKVKIEFSANAGTTWSTIIDSVANLKAYNWTVPASFSTNCLVRVQDSRDGLLSDVSDSVFEIARQPAITVTSPNGGEAWQIGTQHSISWTSVNISSTVKIELSRNHGSSWTTLAASAPNNGSWLWTVTAPASGTCLIRVTDVSGNPTDTSDGDFSIVDIPSISVTSPNGGEAWQIGTQHSISWTSVNISSNVKIELSRNHGSSWTMLAASAPNYGSWLWTVAGPASGTCLIRISDVSGNPTDTSDGDFSIVDVPVISVTSPNGGETWQIGTEQTISWTSANISSNVKIELSRNHGSSWTTLAASAPNNGSWLWTVAGTASGTCLIRVSDAQGNPTDTSDGDFSIVDIPSISVTSPNGGETWQIAALHDVTWSIINSTKAVKIEISRNSGQSWQVLADSTANDGTWSWTITGPSSDSCLFRIGERDGSPIDVSDESFTIADIPSITVTLPNGGEKLNASNQYEITWSSVNISGSVRIELSRNNGSSWSVLKDTTRDDGNWTWDITGPPSDSCLIRISDPDGDPLDVSDELFSITEDKSITIVTPNGGEIWELGMPQQINWSIIGSAETISFSLSRDGGQSWELVATFKEISPGSYSWEWTFSGPPSNSCLIKAADGSGIFRDESDGLFSLHYQTGVTDQTVNTPASYALMQNYPNPFNPETRITYQLPERSQVQIAIFNVAGNLVRMLINEVHDAGTFSVTWDGRTQEGISLPSGIYFCRMTAGAFSQTNRMLYLK